MRHHTLSLLTALFFGLILSLLTSCSLMLELKGCETDQDCPGELTCSDEFICQQSLIPDTCEKDQDCPGELTCNDLQLCQAPSPLLAAPCEQSLGDIDAKDAFIIGVLLPLSGEEEGFGRPLFQAIQLAQEDFNGIGGVNSRPLALLICDTQGRDSLAIDGAEHLAKVGVQAVIGPDYSSQTLEVATKVTIASEMVLVSPSATAAAISHLDDNDLVWRTAASDSVQGHALGELVNFLVKEAPFPRQAEDSKEPPKVALLVRSEDTYALGLRESLIDLLPTQMLSNQDHFTTYDYPNSSADSPDDYTGVIANMMAEEGPKPEIIVILGSAESWTIAKQIESIADHAPIFVFAEAARIPERAAQMPETLRGRIWGTAPQNVGDPNYAPYLSFRIKFQSAYGVSPDDLQFVANAFDALYIIALGASSTGFTGPEIAAGMRRLNSGPTTRPTQTDAQAAMGILRDGGNVNYQGASGPLDFDENGDPNASPIILWCFDDAGLPEAGTILDYDLKFIAHQCGDPPQEPECTQDTVQDDCDTDEICNEDGQCEEDPDL